MRRSRLLVALLTSTLAACGGDDGSGAIDGGGGDDGASIDAHAGGDGGAADAVGSGHAMVNLTHSGACQPDFAQDLVVVVNSGSLAISSTVSPITSLQFDLHETSGTLSLSTAQRMSTGDVINLTSQQTTWTNISNDGVDPIDGTVTINHYAEADGEIDLGFTGVVLQNVQDDSLCTLGGTVVTDGTSF